MSILSVYIIYGYIYAINLRKSTIPHEVIGRFKSAKVIAGDAGLKIVDERLFDPADVYKKK